MTTPQPLPSGYHSVTPYLIVAGLPQLLEFLQFTFNTVERRRMLRPDGTIQHAEIIIGDSIIELSEPNGDFHTQTAALHVYVSDVDATYKRALQAGATSIYEPTDMDYGERGGGVRDAAGNQWYIATFTGSL